jgi:hypothetical protein
LAYLVRFYGLLNIPSEYDRNTSPENSTDISHHVFPCFATKCVCCYLPESSGGWIGNDINGGGDEKKMVAVPETLYTIPPVKVTSN